MNNAYEKVKLSRAKDRPTALKYIENVFEDFIEFHGDRYFADDPSIVGGIASLNGIGITVIGIEKGAGTKEKSVAILARPTLKDIEKHCG